MAGSLNGLQFGSGTVFATPSAGTLALDPTPQEVGVIQDVKLTVGADIKSLFGQSQFPVDSAIGKRSIKGSFNFAQMTNGFFNQAFFGDAVTTGSVNYSYHEPLTIPSTTPYTLTVAQAAHYLGDRGVFFQATGQPLILIPTGTPATGQYLVNLTTGVYTFAAADAGKAVMISYTWTNAAVGTTLTTGNHLMGSGPIIGLDILFPYESPSQGAIAQGVNLPNVRLGKIDMSTKIDDYLMISTDFEAFAGAAGNPINFYLVY